MPSSHGQSGPGLAQAIFTEQAPAPVGPYSQAIRAGGFIFVAGQIPIDPRSGQVIEGPIEVQARQVLDNVKAILAAAGAEMRHVVKATVFLRSMDDFAAVNGVYAQYFPAPPPARSAVEVSRLPRGVGVEIEVIAVDPGARP